MNVPVNIFGMIFFPETPLGNVTGEGCSAESTDLLQFETLLQSAMHPGFQPNTAPFTMFPDVANIPADLDSGPKDLPNQAPDTLSALEQFMANLISPSGPDSPRPEGESSLLDQNLAQAVNPEAGTGADSSTPIESPGLPHYAGTISRNVMDLLGKNRISLEPGTYHVLGSRMEGNRLVINAARDLGIDQQPLRIAIPLDLLKQLTTDESIPSGKSLSRVQLGNSNEALKQIKALLSELNVTEIEITQSSSASTKDSKASDVDIKIVVGKSAEEVIIRGKLASAHLDTSTVEGLSGRRVSSGTRQPDFSRPDTSVLKMDTRHIEQSLTGARFTSESGERVEPEIKPLATPLDTAPKATSGNGTGSGTIRVSSTGNTTLAGGSQEFANSEKETHTSQGRAAAEHITTQFEPILQVKSQDLKPQPVRFTLPQNISAQLKPNGGAVTIRIQPDNLGPAKLSLTMRNDELQARVLVSSNSARDILQGSLDKLVDQLARADIKVDYISVSVTGDGAQNELPGRQPQWRKTGQNRMFTLDNDATNEPIPGPTPPARNTHRQMLGASGVDLLA